MQQIRQNNYYCAILGHLCSGKTTLYNKICKTQNKTKQGGNSVTQQTFVADSRFGNGFKIIDTVGFGVCSKKYQNAILQLSAFQYKPLNQIILTVRFDRIDIMQAFIQMCIAPLEEYKNLITIVVTHYDLLQDKSDVTLIENLLINKFRINKFFFVSIETTGEYICEQIDQRMIETAVQVQISDENFFRNFDLIEENNFLKEKVQEVCNSFNHMSKAVQNKIIQLEKMQTDQDEMDEILHSLLKWIRAQADSLLDKFYKEYGYIMNEHYNSNDNAQDSYIFAIQLRNNILKNLDNIIKLIYEKMMIKQNHPLNYIKECNHCGLIWLKVQGCNGNTECGKAPDDDVLMHQQIKDITVEINYINKQIDIKLILGEIYQKKQKIQSLKKEYELLMGKKSQLDKQLQICKRELEKYNSDHFIKSIFFSSPQSQDLKNIQQSIRDLDNEMQKNDKNIQKLEVELKIKQQGKIERVNQQSLRGCGQPITWSQLKTPSHLLKQLVDDELLSVLTENESNQKKFSQQKTIDLENSISNIIQQ